MKKNRTSILRVAAVGYAALLLICIAVGLTVNHKKPNTEETRKPATVVETVAPAAHMIEGVPVIAQQELNSGCETYACTMLLQSMGFDINEADFADQYLICSAIFYDEAGTRYGPDMHSAFAGTVYNGYGIYAPAMAKSMNRFFSSEHSALSAKAIEGVSLETLCKSYIDRDIPVMVWATVNMDEPYEKASWVVSFVDENATAKEGDTVWWLQNEHCLVLIGYDEDEYYFADSCAGAVSHFEKALCQQRYEQLDTQAIVVQ